MNDHALRFNAAEKAHAEKDFPRAAQLVISLLSEAPEEVRYLSLAGCIARDLGHREQALAMFDKAVNNASDENTQLPRLQVSRGKLLRSLGRSKEALDAFAQGARDLSLRIEAIHGEFHALCDLGRITEARQKLQQLEVLRLPDLSLRLLRARLAFSADEYAKAADLYDSVLREQPENRIAIVQRARIGLELGERDVADRYAAARAAGDTAALIIGHAEALELAGDPRATAPLEDGVTRSPDWIEGHKTLARMRREQGDPDFARDFRRRAEAADAPPALVIAFAETLHGAQQSVDAAEMIARLRAKLGDLPELLSYEAAFAGESGDAARETALLGMIPQDYPTDVRILARAHLRAGRLEAAAKVLDHIDDAADDMELWALRHTVWRQMDPGRAAWLDRGGSLVSFDPLQLSQEELERIASWARALHLGRAAPISQSVRGGTQTRGRLLERREAEAALLAEALIRAVLRYQEQLPPPDAAHPLLKHRERRFRIAGSWSVRLVAAGGGHHAVHVHPAGIVSSACYLVLPQESVGPGTLELGRPPPALGLEVGPVQTITPKVGHLALFPSFMWHGTQPFSQGERLTAAFDVNVSS